MQEAGAAVKPFEELATAMERRHHNMPLIAERLGWPDGTADRLMEVERRFPGWGAWYRVAASRKIPAGSCTARLLDPPRGYDPELFAPDPDALAELIATAEAERRAAASRRGY